MHRHGTGGAGVQLPPLPRGDAERVPPDAARRARSAITRSRRGATSRRSGARPARLTPARALGLESPRVPDLLSIERATRSPSSRCSRPEKRNALSIELRMELAEAFAALSADDDVGCVVLTGAGSAFCSGMDTDQFGGDLRQPRAPGRDEHARVQGGRQCSRPVVARGQRPGAGRRLRARAALRSADRRAGGDLRLPRAATRDPAQLRGGARGAAGDRGPGALPHRADRRARPRRSGSGSSARSRRRRDRRGRSRSPSGSPGCRASAMLETKRRTLLERSHLWGFLFDEEERVFRRALLGRTGRRATA